MLRIISQEFDFFDRSYWLTQERKIAVINVFLSGHGEPGAIPCGKDTQLPYKELVEYVIDRPVKSENSKKLLKDAEVAAAI